LYSNTSDAGLLGEQRSTTLGLLLVGVFVGVRLEVEESESVPTDLVARVVLGVTGDDL